MDKFFGINCTYLKLYSPYIRFQGIEFTHNFDDVINWKANSVISFSYRCSFSLFCFIDMDIFHIIKKFETPWRATDNNFTLKIILIKSFIWLSQFLLAQERKCLDFKIDFEIIKFFVLQNSSFLLVLRG